MTTEQQDAGRKYTPTPTGPEFLRRGLIGAVTALVVARPLVIGEDPGLLHPYYSDAAGLTLTLLWFITALGWGVWRLWSGQRSWRGSLVEVGLFVVVVLVFVSAAHAAYIHPAFIIAWEWLALLLAFLMVRHLAIGPGDNQRLLAAIVAGGIAISVHALYQQSELSDTAAFERQLEQMGIPMDERPFYLARLSQGVFGTYAHPNSFAGYLALVLPVAFGWCVIAWRQRSKWWKPAGVLLGVVCLCAALALTKSRGALLGVGFAGLLVGALHARVPAGLRRALGVGVVLSVLAALAIATAGVSADSGDVPLSSAFERRFEYWRNTVKMLGDADHPDYLWTGVGPGNFGLAYPRYMSAGDLEEVKDPHNFALEMWASGGLFAMLALLAAFAGLFWQSWPAVRGQLEETGDGDEEPEARPRTRWEFYVGGMSGITLGFVLWGSGVFSRDELVIGAVAAGARSLVWFAMFALFESLPWTRATRSAAILAGVIALLVNLTISGGIGFPSVALPLVVMAALALNGLPGKEINVNFVLSGLVPLIASLAALFVYMSVVFYPTTVSQRDLRSARMSQLVYERLLTNVEKEKDVTKRLKTLRSAHDFLAKRIVKPLEEAVKADPGNALARIELAKAYQSLWEVSVDYDQLKGVPADRTRFRNLALSQALEAGDLDPFSITPDYTIYDINLKYAKRTADPDGSKQAHQKAAEAMARVIARDPTRPLWHYLLTEALLYAGQEDQARAAAKQAKELNEQSQGTKRRLSPAQKDQLEIWVRT